MEEKLVDTIIALNKIIKKLHLICAELETATDSLTELPPLPSTIKPEDYD